MVEEYYYHAIQWPKATGGSHRMYDAWTPPQEHGSTGAHIRIDPMESWGALVIHAESLTISTIDTVMSLWNAPPLLRPNTESLPTSIPSHAFRPQEIPYNQPMLVSQPAIDIHVHAQGVQSMEIRGAAAACNGQPCAHSEFENHESYVQRTTAWRWLSSGGSFSASGREAIVLVGGAGVDMTASGSVRLPDLQTAMADIEQLGVSIEGQTLRGKGELSLWDIHTSTDNTAQASLATDLQAIRLDESPLPLQAAASVSAVAAMTLLGLLVWKGKALASCLTGLFTRFDMDGALEHPNRRALFDYVDENPGTTFRELIRATGMAAGTARHHIAVMTRCDVLIERPFGQTLRYFHCDQEQVGDWDAVVVLRQPDLDRMYRWLLDNPGVMQREILDEAESWGWRRSTAQHRLKRLVDNKLALVRDLGRTKSYRARVVDIR